MAVATFGLACCGLVGAASAPARGAASATAAVGRTDPAASGTVHKATDNDPGQTTSATYPLTGFTVALDPGHPGRYNAAVHAKLVPDGRGGRKPCNASGTATASGYPEHAFTFDVARRAAKLLRAQGATVVMTRSTDHGKGLCVNQRGTFGQRHGADVMVSLHADGSTNTSLKGYFG
ncbi:MAG: N-acetylmuramoyl-L-alanine amidase, partial [Bifidobacteriaceae bacterium]|nr:N-acetylmuramoyl-L-alanine amidase [Bifidobacteriaceae bacterium]